MTTIRLLSGDAGTTFGGLENLVLLLAKGSPLPGTASALRRHLREARTQGGVGMLSIIDSSALPTAEARREVLEVGRMLRDVTVAGSVVAATGFSGAAQRSVLTAMTVGAGVRDHVRVFGDVAPAVGWIRSRLALRSHTDDILLAVQRFVDAELGADSARSR